MAAASVVWFGPSPFVAGCAPLSLSPLVSGQYLHCQLSSEGKMRKKKGKKRIASSTRTKHQALLKYWETRPNISPLLSRRCGWTGTCQIDENILLVVWPLEQQEAWTLVPGPWHGGSGAKMKWFHCHTLNWVICNVSTRTVESFWSSAVPQLFWEDFSLDRASASAKPRQRTSLCVRKNKYGVCPGSKLGSKCPCGHENVSHILLLSERAKKSAFFNNSFYYFVVFVLLQFYVIVDKFNGYPWFPQKPISIWVLNSHKSLTGAPAV